MMIATIFWSDRWRGERHWKNEAGQPRPARRAVSARERQSLATDIGCVFIHEAGVAKFGRAYFKPDAEL